MCTFIRSEIIKWCLHLELMTLLLHASDVNKEKKTALIHFFCLFKFIDDNFRSPKYIVQCACISMMYSVYLNHTPINFVSPEVFSANTRFFTRKTKHEMYIKFNAHVLTSLKKNKIFKCWRNHSRERERRKNIYTNGWLND